MKYEVIADVIQKAAASFALLIGGAWVLMNYVRNRTHAPRLQIDLKANIVERGDRRYLLAAIQVKNPGLSVIQFNKPREIGSGPEGSALLVHPLVTFHGVSNVISCDWEEPSAFEILVHHRSIEPGLAINEERFLRLPDMEYDAFWLRLLAAAHGQSWSADAIAISIPAKSIDTSNQQKRE
jgi:hypothetical protein